MHVAVEARAVSAHGGGVKRYVDNLLKGLMEVAGLELDVIYDSKESLGLGGKAREVVVERGRDAWLWWWLNVKLGKQLKSLGPDLVHYTKASVPTNHRSPTVVTIYDVIPILFPESQKWTKRFLWPAVLRQAAHNSDRVITISEQSKRDIVEFLGIQADKVAVTPLAVEKEKFNLRTEEGSAKNDDKPYILFVGTIEPRKNLSLLVRAFSKIVKDIPHQLVIVGKQYRGHKELREQIAKSGVTSRVKVADYVSNEELVSLYRGADLFVWPSIYEGWGFPPQEAMACGTPVIVSNGGSLPEVVGRAGEIVEFTAKNVKDRVNDQGFESALAGKMLEVIGDDSKKRVMVQEGLERAGARDWGMVAKETVEVYREVINK